MRGGADKAEGEGRKLSSLTVQHKKWTKKEKRQQKKIDCKKQLWKSVP
jgi:hypothetical protein